VTQAADQKEQSKTLTDMMRLLFKGIIDPIAAFFNRLGILPNTMTLIGLIGHTIGALFLFQGKMLIGGLVILAMAPVDALDGTMARLRGESSSFGAFVDSVTDRYSELIIFLALIIFTPNKMSGLTVLSCIPRQLVRFWFLMCVHVENPWDMKPKWESSHEWNVTLSLCPP